MAVGSGSGGKSKTTFHNINATHTTLTTSAASSWLRQVKTTRGQSDIQLDTVEFDKTTNDWLETNTPLDTGGGTTTNEEVVLENATKLSSGSSSTQQNFVSISYGPKVLDGSTYYVPVYIALGVLAPDSNTSSFEAGKFIRPAVKINCVTALAAVTVVAACFDSAVIDVTGTFPAPVIAIGTNRPLTVYLPAA